MQRVSLWMIGIGLCITMGLITVEPGYTEERDHAPTCTLKTLKGRYLPRSRDTGRKGSFLIG